MLFWYWKIFDTSKRRSQIYCIPATFIAYYFILFMVNKVAFHSPTNVIHSVGSKLDFMVGLNFCCNFRTKVSGRQKMHKKKKHSDNK